MEKSIQDLIVKKIDEKGSKHFLKYISKEVLKYHKIYGFHLGDAHNNEADAFRHAFMQAFLTCLSDDVAKTLGNAHEENGNSRNQPSGEEQMDLWNNKMGREIGNKIKESSNKKIVNPLSSEVKDEIARKIIEYMRDGKLILDPKGRKVPLKPLKIDKKSDTKNSNNSSSCVGSYPVSSYTRSNGTKVSGYSRTCGASHTN